MISLGSSTTGVHDARISISASLFRGDNFPKDALVTRVTVPLGELYLQLFKSSYSRNQLQPTSGSNGSSCMMGSTSALTNVTQRNSPSHVAYPPGSCKSTKRPLAISSS